MNRQYNQGQIIYSEVRDAVLVFVPARLAKLMLSKSKRGEWFKDCFHTFPYTYLEELPGFYIVGITPSMKQIILVKERYVRRVYDGLP